MNDLQTLSARQVADMAFIDCYEVLNEGSRRQNAAEKKLARLMKQVEKAKREMADAGIIITAAFAEMANPTQVAE